MGGSVGEKIGEGAFADVHAWAPGQVLKLFKAGVPNRIPRYEAYLTRAVFAAGGPALPVLDEVTVDGRRGFVLPRLDGPTLSQSLAAGDATPAQAGAILAGVARAVHATPTLSETLSIRDYMEGSLRVDDGRMPLDVAATVLVLIDTLPADDGLSHCDLHPANVILTAEGPRLIDWTGAKRGGAAMDLTCCYFLLADLMPAGLGDPQTQRETYAAMLAQYARLAGFAPEALAAMVAAHLPVVRAFHLLGGPAPPERRAQLLERLRADLGLAA